MGSGFLCGCPTTTNGMCGAMDTHTSHRVHVMPGSLQIYEHGSWKHLRASIQLEGWGSMGHREDNLTQLEESVHTLVGASLSGGGVQ